MKKNADAQVLRLWKAYQEIKIRTLEADNIRLSAGFIISAGNPRSVLNNPQKNRLATEKFRRYLQNNNIVFQELLVGDPDFNWSEHSFFAQVTASHALNLAKQYQQNAIYQVKQKDLWLLPVLMKNVTATNLGSLTRFSI